MPPSPIPAPLPLWAKALLQLAPLTSGYLLDLLTHANEEADPPAWMRCQVKFSRTAPAGAPDDFAIVTMDIANITGGDLDPTWTSGDFTTVETALNTFWGSVLANMISDHTLVEYRWYLRRFNGLDLPKPYADTGPPVRVTPRGIAGSASAADPLPRQVALTITERTAWPRHWGRMYIPGVTRSQVGPYGRWTAGICTNMATYYQTLATSLQASDFFLVVPVTQVDKQPVRGLLNVSSVQVDDIPDVVRSRRENAAALRVVKP